LTILLQHLQHPFAIPKSVVSLERNHMTSYSRTRHICYLWPGKKRSLR